MSSSRNCRRSRESATGLGRTGAPDFGRTGALDLGRAFGAAALTTLGAFFFAAGLAARRGRGRAAALRAVRFAGFDPLRTAFLVGLRAALRLGAAALRFAIYPHPFSPSTTRRPVRGILDSLPINYLHSIAYRDSAVAAERRCPPGRHARGRADAKSERRSPYLTGNRSI